MKTSKRNIEHFDEKVIGFFRRTYLPVARLALFAVFFWFGFIKLFNISPAEPLAAALTAKTVGMHYFSLLFHVLAFIECLIGVLFLIPKAVRLTIPLLLLHMVLVCSPLILVPELTWQSFLVPTLEGQYILKNLVIVALAFGIAAHTQPLRTKS